MKGVDSVNEATKKKGISKEVKRLNEIFVMMDEESQKISEGLILEVAFMRVTLEDLKNDINKNGAIDEMPQGDYSILRQSPSVQVYNTMIKNYNKNLNDLLSLLPKEMAGDIDDEFDNF